jgi:hypothetical protein
MPWAEDRPLSCLLEQKVRKLPVQIVSRQVIAPQVTEMKTDCAGIFHWKFGPHSQPLNHHH